MIRTITKFFAAAGAACLLLTGYQAKATHAAGSDLTYVNIGPNLYVIQLKVYRDCSGITMGNTETITYRAPGCNASPFTTPLSLAGQFVGNPYCNNVTAGCSTSGPANYQENTFSGTISLPSLCNNWIVSSRINARISSRNLANGATESLFSEAVINNVATQYNNSPLFGQMPIPFVGVDRTVTYNHSVTEPDGDSLVFSLQPALSDLNTPVVYGNYQAGTSPAGTAYPAGTFSATNPIISQNPLQLNPVSGNITFRPLSHAGPSVPPSQSVDKYVMVVQVEEYRKISGVATKIGHVRRDMLVTVIDCGPNQLPTAPGFRIGTTTQPNGAVVPVAAHLPVNITIDVTDANPNQIITLTSNVANALPNATVTITNGTQSTATISWTATTAQIRQAPYFFTVTATDDACPVKGFQTFTLGLRVNNTGGVNGVSKSLAAGCFTAFPNPTGGSEVTFKIKADAIGKNGEVIIYNLTGKVIDRIPVSTDEEQVQWHKKAELPAGVYFARYTSAAGTQTVKLVHQK